MTKGLTEKDINNAFNGADKNTEKIIKLLEQEITDGVDNTDAVMELVRDSYRLLTSLFH